MTRSVGSSGGSFLSRRSDSTSSSASSSMGSHGGGGGSSSHGCNDVLTLYVRAGFDSVRYGACPFCQRIFMVLMIKAEGGQ